MDQLGKFGGLTWQILGKQGGRCPTVAQIDEILGGLSSLFLLQEHYGSPMSDLGQTLESFGIE